MKLSILFFEYHQTKKNSTYHHHLRLVVLLDIAVKYVEGVTKFRW